MRQAVYARRRRGVLSDMGKEAVLVLPTAPTALRNGDVEHPYRFDSDFHYLTGFSEPEAILVLAPGRREGRYVLFCRPRDAESERWTGRRAGLEGAREVYGADEAYSIDDFDEVLPRLLSGRRRLYYETGRQADLDERILACLERLRRRARSGVSAPDEIVGLSVLLHERRLIKDADEIAAMRRAAEISVAAHHRLMRRCRPGLREYELEAELVYEFISGGCRRPAYPSIVASGPNACILHYTENMAGLADGDLLLVDAGAEFEGYAADITRTIPVNGRFNTSQRAIYELVLAAQQAAIREVRPGRRWDAPHRAAVRVVTRGLRDLGLLSGDVDELVRNESYKPFFMHKTGHWLGLDVHDVGAYKLDGRWRRLEPGMVLTVEPGIYIAEGMEGVDPRWWGIGVRIEDDVLVTDDGHDVLTSAAVKTVDAIEALMAEGGRS